LALAALLVAPILLFTFDLWRYPVAPPGFWQWWSAGMVMLGPVILIYELALVVVYLAARLTVR